MTRREDFLLSWNFSRVGLLSECTSKRGLNGGWVLKTALQVVNKPMLGLEITRWRDAGWESFLGRAWAKRQTVVDARGLVLAASHAEEFWVAIVATERN